MENFVKDTQVDVDESKFVEVLTAAESGEVIGHSFGGARPGPNLLVSGEVSLMEALFDRLSNLPTLPWMWGRIYLVTIDGLDFKGLGDIKKCLHNISFDEVVLLPYVPSSDAHDASVDEAYWATLRLCRNLGMIAGRGISDGGILDPAV